jgi:hypothetical protein
MPSLNSQLEALAHAFVNDVISAIRGSSLQELLVPGAGKPAGRTPRGVPAGGGGKPDPVSVPVKKGKAGRLKRRSAEEIAALLGKIVLLVKTHKEGMRAEEIRAKLGLESKEMPRILKEGLAEKKLSSKGQKRATTYFVK